MAISRASPYIWVKWLAGIMSGDNPCHWQAWFLTKNQLREKQPSDFNLVAWKIDHSRMLADLTKGFSRKVGVLVRTEYELKQPFNEFGATLAGKADCLCWDTSGLTVYDIKTGKERDSDQIQVMIYMWMLSKHSDFTSKKIRGEVVYTNRRQPIEKLPDDFEDNLNYFVKLLCDREAPMKSAGSPCKFCAITKSDCPDRIENNQSNKRTVIPGEGILS